MDIILAWLARHQPDALALQETKCRDEDFPAQVLADAGWRVAYRGEKSYNGVAVITREKPKTVSFGLQDGDHGESETRFAHVRLGPVHLLNSYVPQGRDLESEHFQFKLQWFARVRKYLEDHFDAARSRVVWVGDMNVAPTPMDVYESKKVWPHVCHCEEVIQAFEDTVSWGMEDVFRKHLPQEGVFTFWDYRAPSSVERNMGWRIDHILATPALARTSSDCFVDIEPRKAERPSDHTFVAARFDT